MMPDDRDLDALLRQPTERLLPADGSWEHITRRARRRRWAKASLAVAAGVVIVAGAVPAVIAVRGNSNDQTLAVSKSQSQFPHNHVTGATVVPTVSSPSAAIAPSLTGFFPNSLSFVSQFDGYAWGSVGRSKYGSVAYTDDGGTSWTQLAAPKIENSFVTDNPDSDGQIRFGSGAVGFVFGAKYFVTLNSGQSWTQYQSPGYIDDLETVSGQIWALVRPSKDSRTVNLYSATVSDPTLRRVPGVSTMTGVAGADSVAVTKTPTGGASADVIVGGSAFYVSRNGVTWHQRLNPCQGLPGVQNALISTLNVGDVVAACGYDVSGGAEDKRVYVTTNAARQWTATAHNPAGVGYLQTFAAGTRSVFIIGDSRGGAQITYDGGETWSPDLAKGVELSFVGFIDVRHIVGLADRADESQGAFATSENSGRKWVVTPFPK